MTRYLLCRIPQFVNRGDNFMTPLRVLARVIKNHGLETPRMVSLYILASFRIANQSRLAKARGDTEESKEVTMSSPWRVFHRMYMDRVLLCGALVVILLLNLTGVLSPLLALALALPCALLLLLRPGRKAHYRFRDRKGCEQAAASLVREGTVTVIMGHTHHLERQDFDAGSYINTGAFLDLTERGRSFAVVDSGGARLDYLPPSG
jgi:hypothetical protein